MTEPNEWDRAIETLEYKIKMHADSPTGKACVCTDCRSLTLAKKAISIARRVEEKKIADRITRYFVLEKRWLRKKGRLIYFGEDDSERLAQAITKSLVGPAKEGGG